jgi:hypothetical protein
MNSTVRDMPQTEVMYRTIIYVAKTHDDCMAAIAVANRRNLYCGGVSGIGLSILSLTCTPGELAQVGQDLRALGIECKEITACDAPRRPDSWSQPVFRDNWQA